MTLQIDLAPELEQALACEAARRGQSLPDYARSVLERSVQRAEEAEAVFASFWRDLPRRSPADLLTMAHEQGVQPVRDLDAITGGWPEDDSVDDFLAAREAWQWEGRVPGTVAERARG